jgi:fluoroquinolone transport system ATP-binding protein
VLPVGGAAKETRSAAREGGPVRIGANAAPSVRLFGRREAMIAVNGLTYSYSNREPPAINALNFEIRRGEIFGFLGPSGAGKSTTQKILIGLLTGYSGSVSVLGKPLGSWGAGYYERIGVSFEMPIHFLKLTALENLRYFAALYARPGLGPQALLEKVGLQADGGKLVAEFSKGMKNRLNVARSLVNDPELLFLDEPTCGLDPVNARLIKDLIREQQRSGKTVFLTTHTMTLAEELCDRVAFLVDGRIRLIDAPRELKLRFGRPVVRVEFRAEGRAGREDFPLETLGRDEAFLRRIRSADVQTIHTQEATLEDIFLKMTGAALAGGEEAA